MSRVCLLESCLGDNVDIQKPIWKHFPSKKCQISQMCIFLKIDFTHSFTTPVKTLSVLGVCLLWIFLVFFMDLNAVLDLCLLSNLVIPGGISQSISITIYNKMDFPILLITVLISIYELVIPSINPLSVIGVGPLFSEKAPGASFYFYLQSCRPKQKMSGGGEG